MDDLNYVAKILAGEKPAARSAASTRHKRHAQTSKVLETAPESRKPDRPSNKSTPRIWHCSTCNVWLPAKGNAWTTHIQGIRHRRERLSLELHGKHGCLVISTFENKDPQQHAPKQSWHDSKCMPSILAQLLQIYGHGDIYTRAALASSSIKTIPGGDHHVSNDDVTSSSEVFALSHAIKCREIDPPFIALQKECITGSETALWVASVCELFQSLISSSTALESITLRLSVLIGTREEFKLGWRHLLHCLRELVRALPSVASVSVHLWLSGGSQQAQRETAHSCGQLKTVSLQSALAIRKHLLLAYHPRVGRNSILSLLPQNALLTIMNHVAPLRPPEVMFNGHIL